MLNFENLRIEKIGDYFYIIENKTSKTYLAGISDEEIKKNVTLFDLYNYNAIEEYNSKYNPA